MTFRNFTVTHISSTNSISQENYLVRVNFTQVINPNSNAILNAFDSIIIEPDSGFIAQKSPDNSVYTGYIVYDGPFLVPVITYLCITSVANASNVSQYLNERIISIQLNSENLPLIDLNQYCSQASHNLQYSDTLSYYFTNTKNYPLIVTGAFSILYNRQST